MKIQEALSKVKELKTDATKLLGEAQRKKEKVIYLSIEEQYGSVNTAEVDSLIEEAISKLAHAHDLKLAVQKANALTGITDLIQEKDFLKMVCSWLEPLRDVDKETDPKLENTFGGTSEAVFMKKVATFNTEEVSYLYEKAVDRIREIEIEMQRKNWEVDIDEVLTEKFMNLLDSITD